MGCKNCSHGSSTPRGAMNTAKIQSPDSTEVRSWTELPLLDVTNVPEDLDLIGGSNKEFQAWRIPASYFLPGGTLNQIRYKVPNNNTQIVVPERQVVPVRVGNSLTPWSLAKATTGETATALAIAKDEESLTLMGNGFFTFDRPHPYEIGKTYYLSQEEEGAFITVKPTAGIVQPLFSVVDQLTILVNIQLV